MIRHKHIKITNKTLNPNNKTMDLTNKIILATIISFFAFYLTSCGFKATYTSPKTGIKYVVTEGEDGKPNLEIDSSKAVHEKNGIKIEVAK